MKLTMGHVLIYKNVKSCGQVLEYYFNYKFLALVHSLIHLFSLIISLAC